MIRLNDYLKEQFGQKIYKLSLSSGCTCPNRDGSKGYGGCSFCSEGGSGDFVPGNLLAAGSRRTDPILDITGSDSTDEHLETTGSEGTEDLLDLTGSSMLPIDQQINRAKALISKKTDAEKFIGYFQSFTNTYGGVDRLKKIYMETICRDDIVALSIGTRPDCLGREVMDMLSELNEIKPVWVELGLQTIHPRTAEAMSIGYDLETFERGYRALKDAGITVVVHVIFGFPGETKEDMLDTVRYLAGEVKQLDDLGLRSRQTLPISAQLDIPVSHVNIQSEQTLPTSAQLIDSVSIVRGLSEPPEGIKIQMLNILEGTELGRTYKTHPFPLLTMEEYGDLLVEALRILPKDIVLHRMTGDGPKKILIAPEWVKDKRTVLNYLNKRLTELDA